MNPLPGPAQTMVDPTPSDDSSGAGELVLPAPAKINLCLRIVGRRKDGYHLLSTLMQKIDLVDEVRLRYGEGIVLRCPNSDLPEDETNLAWRAAELFRKTMGERLPMTFGVEITLHKRIPVAAGLGGGSSDAAAVLLGLDQLFGTFCTRGELIGMGVQLGADVPFFVVPEEAAWASGIGEILEPAPVLEETLVLLVNPGFSVSTRWAFETFALTVSKNIFNLNDSQNKSQLQPEQIPDLSGEREGDVWVNDLETVTVSRYPEIQTIKERLVGGGAVAAMMSGSGATVFGLFPYALYKQAEACYAALRQDYPLTYLVDARQRTEQ
ncbi:4-(cytidine 5'-diphospho)-2-C-methyl-D-erythritol kinase [Desulfolithobacter sp.]